MLSLLPSRPSVRHIMGAPCVCVTSCRYPMSVRQIMGTPLCQCITSWGHPRVYASYHGIPLCRCITSWGHACVCITSCGHPVTVRCEMRRRRWGRWLQTKNFYTLIRSGLASLCILLRGNSFRLRAIIYMMEGRKISVSFPYRWKTVGEAGVPSVTHTCLIIATVWNKFPSCPTPKQKQSTVLLSTIVSMLKHIPTEMWDQMILTHGSFFKDLQWEPLLRAFIFKIFVQFHLIFFFQVKGTAAV